MYGWRKRDTIVCDRNLKEFSELPLEDMTPLQYFSEFITTTLLDIVAEQTNITLQTIRKSIDTNRAEIMYLIRISIKMGVVQLPSYKLYWNRKLRCLRIANVMPRNRYQELLRCLHFVKNDIINAQDKLANIRPLISIV